MIEERGKPARVDRRTGEVHGSGSAAGGSGTPGEDYDAEPYQGGGRAVIGGPKPIHGAERRPAAEEGPDQ